MKKYHSQKRISHFTVLYQATRLRASRPDDYKARL
jgi:hypothetical protein